MVNWSCKFQLKQPDQSSLSQGRAIFNSQFSSPDSITLSISHLSPLGSQVSIGQLNANRIESVADWEAIAKKYRLLVGSEIMEVSSGRDLESENSSTVVDPLAAQQAAAAVAANNVNPGAQNQV